MSLLLPGKIMESEKRRWLVWAKLSSLFLMVVMKEAFKYFCFYLKYSCIIFIMQNSLCHWVVTWSSRIWVEDSHTYSLCKNLKCREMEGFFLKVQVWGKKKTQPYTLMRLKAVYFKRLNKKYKYFKIFYLEKGMIITYGDSLFCCVDVDHC